MKNGVEHFCSWHFFSAFAYCGKPYLVFVLFDDDENLERLEKGVTFIYFVIRADYGKLSQRGSPSPTTCSSSHSARQRINHGPKTM